MQFLFSLGTPIQCLKLPVKFSPMKKFLHNTKILDFKVSLGNYNYKNIPCFTDCSYFPQCFTYQQTIFYYFSFILLDFNLR